MFVSLCISSGYLVLRDLGFKVDKYIASEICKDSLAVSRINHEGKIMYVDDVRFITEQQVDTLSILHRPQGLVPKGWSPRVFR